MTYSITTLQPAPSMCIDIEVIEAANYTEAVERAQASFMQTRRTTCLCSGKSGLGWYHRITPDGVALDRNTNSGVPTEQRLVGGGR